MKPSIKKISYNGWEGEWKDDHIKVSHSSSSVSMEYKLAKQPCCKICGTPLFQGKVCGEPTRDGNLELANGSFQLGRYYASRLEQYRTDPLTKNIIGLKNNPDYAVPIGIALSLLMLNRHDLLLEADTLIPIPSKHNQSVELCKVISDVIFAQTRNRIEVKNCIRKDKEITMHNLGLFERIDAVDGMYSAIEPVGIKNKSVIIVDDIITTGLTLGECLKILKPHGASKMFTLIAGANFS
jgi:predicted amidophosphoribosyltransferase